MSQDSQSTPDSVSTPEVFRVPQFLIRPAEGVEGDYIQLEGEAGSKHTVEVVLGNSGTAPLDLLTYDSDVIPVVNGGFDLESADAEEVGTSRWIDYDTEVLRLAPGEGVERTLSIAIPDDASPGQYIAGISVETAEPLSIEGTSQFTQVLREAIAVFITIPGPTNASFQVGVPEVRSSGAMSVISVYLGNTGNVLVLPQGQFQLMDAKGNIAMESPIVMGPVYAGFEVPLELYIPPELPSGDYVLTLGLTDEATGITVAMDNQPVSISNEAEAPDPFEIAAGVSLQPEGDDPVYAEVSAKLTNNGEAVNATEVVLDVMKDGELTESFTLASSLALPPGETEVAQRYIPPSGFESGEWTFVIRLNVVDPNTGASTTVATLEDVPPVTVP